jgi:uncharacterized YigZ family protein
MPLLSLVRRSAMAFETTARLAVVHHHHPTSSRLIQKKKKVQPLTHIQEHPFSTTASMSKAKSSSDTDAEATNTFITIASNATSESLIKKSRFIAIASGSCGTHEEAMVRLLDVRKDYPSSCHVCYAWIGSAESEIERSSDDGEPASTAGLPILAAIKGENLSSTLVCVVRYFGGVKLGVGGLTRAYGGVAREALRSAAKEVVIPKRLMQVSVKWENLGSVYDMARKFNGRVLLSDDSSSSSSSGSDEDTGGGSSYDDNRGDDNNKILMRVEVPLQYYSDLEEAIIDATKGDCGIS